MLTDLPSPVLTIGLEIAACNETQLNFTTLPARPGVFAIEDEHGRTIAIATTANVRRMVASKLRPPDENAATTRRVNVRAIGRRVLFSTVGSSFEADWAYLQIARQRWPHTYRELLDRWQAWFVSCDPTAAFPQFLKTPHPTVNDAGTIHLGPFPDKHAAARYIEMLQNAFDLCRYHHLLMQAPHASACVYKEMGRCAAPCDGSISMDEYRRSIANAIAFSTSQIEPWRQEVQHRMEIASANLEFETAQRDRLLLDRTSPATKSEFRFVDQLDRFRFVAVMPGPAKSTARLFLIRGGWIEPVADLPIEPTPAQLADAIALIENKWEPQPSDFSAAAIENIGCVCRHLFHPKLAKSSGSFLSLHSDQWKFKLSLAVQRLHKHTADELEQSIADRDLESVTIIRNPA